MLRKTILVLLSLFATTAFADPFPNYQEQEIFDRVASTLNLPYHEADIYRDWYSRGPEGKNWQQIGAFACQSYNDPRFCVNAVWQDNKIKIAHWDLSTVYAFNNTSSGIHPLNPCRFSMRRLASLYLHESLHAHPFYLDHDTPAESAHFASVERQLFRRFLDRHGTWLSRQEPRHCRTVIW